MQCPQCHNDVPVTEAQYGALYTCPKCMAVYFVNFDGLPEYGDMTLDSIESNTEEAVEASSDFSMPVNLEEPSLNSNTEENGLSQDLNSWDSTPLADSESQNVNEIISTDFSTNDQTSNSEYDFSGANPFEAASENEALGEAVAAKPVGSKIENSFNLVAQEIENFANQETVISAINYSVNIKGLDTKELMEKFKESIEDSKFGWIAKDILDQAKDGECKINNLNPIQAYVLAQRLQFLDLDCRWEQHVQI